MTAPRPAARKAAAATKATKATRARSTSRSTAPPEVTGESPIPATRLSTAAGLAAPASLPAVPARSRFALLTDPTSVVPVYAGVVTVVVGFALIFISWSEVAGQSSVWQQMPLLLSTGFPGLGLIMAGLVVVNLSVKRQDGARRTAQMAGLTEAVTELRRVLEDGS